MATNHLYKGKHLWQDPLEDVQSPGLLLSDQIAYYAETCVMIAPFTRKDLRPAAYTLHVGDTYYANGELHSLPDNQDLTIPPNGLVYITIHEYLNLPYYMVAHYSLRVKQVYRGLILDNGLQVDPGYHGQISVPVYNFTDEPKRLKPREAFLSIEFIRTTRFRPHPPINANEEKDWVRPDLVGSDGRPLKLFQDSPDELYHHKDIREYFQRGEKNGSSVLQIRNDMEGLRKEFDLFRTEMRSGANKHKAWTNWKIRFAWAAIVGGFLAIVLLFIQIEIANNAGIADAKANLVTLSKELADAKASAASLSKDLATANTATSTTSGQVADLSNGLGDLRNAVNALSARAADDMKSVRNEIGQLRQVSTRASVPASLPAPNSPSP